MIFLSNVIQAVLKIPLFKIKVEVVKLPPLDCGE
jgi:hypothetical protein